MMSPPYVKNLQQLLRNTPLSSIVDLMRLIIPYPDLVVRNAGCLNEGCLTITHDRPSSVQLHASGFIVREGTSYLNRGFSMARYGIAAFVLVAVIVFAACEGNQGLAGNI
jgi:hypothetical protein